MDTKKYVPGYAEEVYLKYKNKSGVDNKKIQNNSGKPIKYVPGYAEDVLLKYKEQKKSPYNSYTGERFYTSKQPVKQEQVVQQKQNPFEQQVFQKNNRINDQGVSEYIPEKSYNTQQAQQGETISQGSQIPEEQPSVLNRVAKILLPKRMEDFFGLNKPSLQKRLVSQEKDREGLKRDAEREKIKESIKNNPNIFGRELIDPSYKTPAEKTFLNIVNSPEVQPIIKNLGRATSGTGIVSAIQAVGPKTFTEAYEANKAYQAGDKSKIRQFLYQLGDSAPQTAIGVALNFIPYAGKPLSTAYWTALSSSEQIENKGQVESTVNIGVDVLLDSVLGKTIESLFKAPTKSLLSTITKTFTAEGGTEVAQDLLKMANNYREAKTDKEKEDAIKAGKEYFTSGQVLMTLGVGGITGAGIGAGAQVLNNYVQNNTQQEQSGQDFENYLNSQNTQQRVDGSINVPPKKSTRPEMVATKEDTTPEIEQSGKDFEKFLEEQNTRKETRKATPAKKTKAVTSRTSTIETNKPTEILNDNKASKRVESIKSSTKPNKRLQEDRGDALTQNVSKDINTEQKTNTKSLNKQKEAQQKFKVENVLISSLPERATAIGVERNKFNSMANSIKSNGVQNPIIIDNKTGQVLDGQTRAFVSKELGLTSIPAIKIDSSNYTLKEIQDISNNFYKNNPKQQTGVKNKENKTNKRVENKATKETKDKRVVENIVKSTKEITSPINRRVELSAVEKEGIKNIAKKEEQTPVEKQAQKIIENPTQPKMKLIDRLHKMKRDGATENDFLELEIEYMDKYYNGETKTDKSLIINDFIETNYRSGTNDRLYSKGSQSSINTAEIRKNSTTREFKLFNRAIELIRKYGKYVSEKNLPRGSIGVHYRKTGNIAVNSLNDIPTVVHELAHAIDTVELITKKINLLGSNDLQKSLISVYENYYGKPSKSALNKVKIEEGFATLVENYSMNPTKIKAEYPKLVEQIFEDDGFFNSTRVNNLVKDVDSILTDYQQLTSLQKKRSIIVTDGTVSEKRSPIHFMDKVISFFSDFTAPLSSIARDNGVEGTDKDPAISYKYIRSANNVSLYNITQDNEFYTMGKDGNIRKVFNYTLRGLGRELIKNKDYHNYTAYLTSRRVYYENLALKSLQLKARSGSLSKNELDEYKTLTEIKRKEGWDFELDKDVYESNKDNFKEYDKKFDSIMNHYIKALVDADMISRDAGLKMLSTPGYAPFFRSMVDEVSQGVIHSNEPKLSTKIKSFFGRKGSKKAIIDPFVSAIRVSSSVFEKIITQKTLENLYELNSPNAIKEVAINPLPLGDKIIFPKVDGNTATFKYKGKNVALELNKDLMKVFKIGNELHDPNTVQKGLKYATSIFVKSTTGVLYPAFMFTNILIDTPSAIAQTKYNMLPVLDGIRYLTIAKINKNSLEAKTWNEYKVLGGLDQAQISSYEKTPNELLREVGIRPTVFGPTKEMFKNIGEVLSKPSKLSEVLNRYPEYHLSRKAGNSSMVAIEDANNITANFKNRGTLGGIVPRSLMELVAYGNSAIQVPFTALKAMRNPKTRPRAAAVYLTLMASGVASFLIMMSRYKKALDSGDKEDIEKVESAINEYKNLNLYSIGNNFIGISSEKTGRKLNRIRTSDTYFVLAKLAVMALAEQELGADYSYYDYIKAVKDPFVSSRFDLLEGKNAIVSWTPNLIKGYMEASLGVKTFPEVGKLAPFYMDTWNSEDQYFPYTNDLAISLGQTETMKANKISPLQIEQFIKTTFGRGLEAFVKYSDEGFPGLLKAQKENFEKLYKNESYLFSGKGYKQFYEDRNRVNNEYSKANDKKDRDVLREIGGKNTLYNNISSIMSDFRKINNGTDIDIPKEYSNDIYNIIELLNKGKFEEAEDEYKNVNRPMQTFIKRNMRLMEIEKRKSE